MLTPTLPPPPRVGYILTVGSKISKPESTPAAAPTEGERLTPAMQQYRQQKQQVGDAILLFRMGDFHEMLYETG